VVKILLWIDWGIVYDREPSAIALMGVVDVLAVWYNMAGMMNEVRER
jgi:hypothetical protein